MASRPLPPYLTLRLEFPPNSSPPRSSSPNSPWSENFNNNVVNYLQPSHQIQQLEPNPRIKRRHSSDRYKSDRRNTFVINFNGLKNGFRPRNIGNRFLSAFPSSSQTNAEFSPPYAVPSTLISGTSWTSANGFHLTSHHQLNGVNQVSTTHQDKSELSLESKEHEEDPNKIVEIESDDSPPYLPSTTAQQRPKTTTPQPSPTAPPMGKTSELNEDSSFIQADFHHEEGPAFQFNLSGQKEELSC